MINPVSISKKHIADRTLIIPTLRLKDGKCAQVPVGEAGTEHAYPSDPVEQAVMWRHENMKLLHVIAEDTEVCSFSEQLPLLRRIVDAVDISVQIEARYADEEEVELVLKNTCAYRAILNGESSTDTARVAAMIARFGPRSIVPTLKYEAGEDVHGKEEHNGTVCLLCTATAFADCGVERVVVDARHVFDGPPIKSLLSLVEQTNLSVTLNGSVSGYQDLRLLSPLRKKRVDSIIMENALYSNAFPCQKIWRQAEQQLIFRNKPL